MPDCLVDFLLLLTFFKGDWNEVAKGRMTTIGVVICVRGTPCGRALIPADHFQGVYDQFCFHVMAKDPADHFARVQIDRRCQVFKAFGRK